MERKILTIALIIPLITRFSHKFPLPVKNKIILRIIPRIKVATTEIAVIYNVSIVASNIISQSTFGNNCLSTSHHLHANLLLFNKFDCAKDFFIASIYMNKQCSIRTISCLRNFPLNNIYFKFKITN